MPARSLVAMRDQDITNQAPGQVDPHDKDPHDGPANPSPAFADPIGYLAGLGITAEIVPNTDTASPLPVAA